MFYFINVILFFVIILFHFSNSLIPLWNFKNSTSNILNKNESTSILIHTSMYFNFKIELTHIFNKSSEEISQNKKIIIKDDSNKKFFEGTVEFNDIHSFYRTIYENIKYYYFICPKGSNKPLILNEKKWNEIDFKNLTLNEDSDLLCYYHSSPKDNTLLFMFSNTEFVYGYSIRKEINLNFSNHILDFILNDHNDVENMIIVYLHNNSILLESASFNFKEFKILSNMNNITIDENPFSIVQCTFVKVNQYTLYCLTYDKNSSNFSSGYSSNDISSSNSQTSYNKHTKIPFEFINNISIQSIKLIKKTSFAQYIITVDEKDPISEINKEITYFGILDISKNQILFNSNEKIKQIYPSNIMTNEYIIITESSVYKLCGTAKNEGNCIQQCPKYLKLNPEDYNTCTNDISCNNQIYLPYNICISKCDTDIFYSNGTNCGLCKDIDPNNPIKIYGENNCTNSLSNNTYKTYQLYPLLNIYKKCSMDCEKCYGKYSNNSHNCE